jgi:hypothetical protein
MRSMESRILSAAPRGGLQLHDARFGILAAQHGSPRVILPGLSVGNSCGNVVKKVRSIMRKLSPLVELGLDGVIVTTALKYLPCRIVRAAALRIMIRGLRL